MKIRDKICRKWMKIRLQPIRVFCLHHVSEQFNAESMNPCDWMALDEFKRKIIVLRNQGYQFISLIDAYNHLKNDYFRRKKYAVLTFDDGYKSLNDVSPWLEEQNIPATLFINVKYLDGKSYRENPKEQYLTYDELFAMTNSLIEIGHHGWEHISAYNMDKDKFIDSLERSIEVLAKHPRYIPFWAYTWGHNNEMSNELLKQYSITPVLITGEKKYKFKNYIDRELL